MLTLMPRMGFLSLVFDALANPAFSMSVALFEGCWRQTQVQGHIVHSISNENNATSNRFHLEPLLSCRFIQSVTLVGV